MHRFNNALIMYTKKIANNNACIIIHCNSFAELK